MFMTFEMTDFFSEYLKCKVDDFFQNFVLN